MPGPRQLYVHVPFCRSRCVYCAFYSTTDVKSTLLNRFIDAAIAELSAVVDPGPWETVYLGGGTPSLLGVERLSRLLEGIRRITVLAEDAEVTIEANPEGLAPGDAAGYRDAGMTRLSLGVQSFDDDDLATLGRPHDAATARQAVTDALRAGLRVSVDLIYGLPGRPPAHWLAQLDAAVETGVEHLSAYELSLEPGTRLAAAWPDGLGDRADLFFRTHGHLASLGLEGYEVSNFARTAKDRSRHNLATWAHRPYLGLGPGAHSFFDGPGSPTRRWNLQDLPAWLADLEHGVEPPREEEVLSAGQRLLERVMLGVRTSAGVDLTACRRECGGPLTNELLAKAVDPIEQGLLSLAGDQLRPTLQGMALADRLAMDLSP